MTVWRTTLGSVLIATVALGCSGDDDPAAPSSTTVHETTSSSTTTAPERPASTTTTALDPATVEGQVEAAYLRSWDVYADAVYDLQLDESALAEVYADALLDARLAEIRSRVEEGRAASVLVEHNYSVSRTGPATAAVIDNYRNHQVLIDPVTKTPTEADPNELITDVFTARLVDGTWRFFEQTRIR